MVNLSYWLTFLSVNHRCNRRCWCSHLTPCFPSTRSSRESRAVAAGIKLLRPRSLSNASDGGTPLLVRWRFTPVSRVYLSLIYLFFGRGTSNDPSNVADAIVFFFPPPKRCCWLKRQSCLFLFFLFFALLPYRRSGVLWAQHD